MVNDDMLSRSSLTSSGSQGALTEGGVQINRKQGGAVSPIFLTGENTFTLSDLVNEILFATQLLHFKNEEFGPHE